MFPEALMRKPTHADCPLLVLVITTITLLSFSGLALAAQADPILEERVEALEQELRELKRERSEATELKERVDTLERELKNAKNEAFAEERATTQFHLAGYAFAGFTENDENTDSFGAGSFNPGFHFQYKDLMFFEAELEFSTDDDGATETELEYADMTWLAHDYLAIKAGKWLSPVGQFQERLHPAWINKLPNAPAGFGHGGAQPLSDVGVQFRGGIPLGSSLFNYVLAVGNGPRIGHHGPELEGFGADDNGNKAVSGRIGFLPIPNVEIGVSFLRSAVDGEEAAGGPCDASALDEACEPTAGDFDLWGADFAITPGAWDIRGEYLNSELDALFSREGHGDAHTTRIPETEWEAWYVQAAYQLRGVTNIRFFQSLELVTRYGEFRVDGFNEFGEDTQDRWSAGINYLFAPSVIAKLAFESRDFDDPDRTDDEQIVGQIAFGF